MGARLIAKGVDGEAFAFEYAAPVRRGLEGVFFLNGSMEKIAKNFAAGKAPATVVGTPVVGPNFSSFRGMANYLQTQIGETESMTLFAIVKAVVVNGDTSQLPLFLGTYTTGAPNGVSMFSADPAQIRGSAAVGADVASNVNQTVSVSPIVMSDWNLASVVVTPTTLSVQNHTKNLINTVNLTAPRLVSTRTVRIGSGYSNAQAGACDMMLAQINSVAMTADERKATADDFRAYAARRGIIV